MPWKSDDNHKIPSRIILSWLSGHNIQEPKEMNLCCFSQTTSTRETLEWLKPILYHLHYPDHSSYQPLKNPPPPHFSSRLLSPTSRITIIPRQDEKQKPRVHVDRVYRKRCTCIFVSISPEQNARSQKTKTKIMWNQIFRTNGHQRWEMEAAPPPAKNFNVRKPWRAVDFSMIGSERITSVEFLLW